MNRIITMNVSQLNIIHNLFLIISNLFNIWQIKKIFDYFDDLDYFIVMIIRLLFTSSNIIKYVYIYNTFDILDYINEYMKNHKIYLSLYNKSLKLNMLKNTNNLKGLT